ncbi:hypothetical protein [Aestuariivita boseongensis]|uniref:hypothetical protein n=1 Tax=Aestuariivita boseongensis TaxID=1470562 RepID=UPI0009E334EB|nr:hypothetical protein [Aestuariivita boseongensis]
MKKFAVSFIALALTATAASADVVGPGGKTIDCYCTDKSGARVELGEMICLQVDGRMFMAQCQMSLNVPMWREVSEGCLSSGLSPVADPLQRSQPAINTISVYPKI